MDFELNSDIEMDKDGLNVDNLPEEKGQANLLDITGEPEINYN